jgi:hypothetical protein
MLVYVDPNARTIVGPVEWLPTGKPKKVPMAPIVRVEREPKPDEKDRPVRPRREPKERFYPWCSYRTAKKVYRVAGKEREPERTQPFEEALQKALQEPYWD